jgi:hypothetical protein
MEHGDMPFFKDGYYIYSTGQMVCGSDMIVGSQSLDNKESDNSSEEEK